MRPCRRCGTALLPGKHFCHACGAPAGDSCPRCGSEVEPEFAFCPECGFALRPAADTASASTAASDDPVEPSKARPVSVPPQPELGEIPGMRPESRVDRLVRDLPETLADKLRSTSGATGERKRATVMFCDLVGSTGIAARLDPEEYRDLLDRYLEICFREIYRYEGIVNQLAGDGMMALFGAPIAHEDAPERAVRAALAIREALLRFNAESLASRDFDLHTRFGINTGPVLAGAVGNDLKMDYTAIGDTTNLASRLESLAPPDGILVSEATARLIRARFEMRVLPPLTVKGKSEPVIAYEVERARDADGVLHEESLREMTPLVARDEELEQLLACFRRLPGRLPQMVAIVGEAGSGKSRLVFEFKQRLAAESATVLEARCSSLSQMVPYAPWTAMVRQYFGVGPNDSHEAALAKVRAVVETIDDDPEGLTRRLAVFFRRGHDFDGEMGEGLRREAFDAMGRLIDDLCAKRPLVMILEDLHWIDDLSRETVELAVSTLRTWPFMVLVTHRPEFEARWRSGAAFTELHLRPLGDTAATELVRSVAGGALPAELERRIVEKAEGNPLLLEEIARSLAEQGFLRRLDDRIELTRPLAEIPIPETVQELIGARLDRLGRQGKRVAQVAAVLGRQFRRDMLAQMLDGEGIEIGPILEELERRGLIHRKSLHSEDEYRFGESVTQELAYDSLLLRDRRQLHERIAHLIEAEPGEMTPERSALLAHHYALSDDRTRAAEALLRAATDAERLPSYGAALKLYRQAYETSLADLGANADPARQRSALTAAVGLARVVTLYGSSEDLEDLVAIARQGREIAERLGDPTAQALLSLYEGLFEMSGGGELFARGLALIESGAAIARRHGLKMVELNLARGLSWGYLFDGRFAEALETVDVALAELAAIDGDRPSDLQFGARFMRENMLMHAGQLDQALVGLGATNAAAVERNNRTIRSASAASLAQLHWLRGEYEEAIRWADEGLEIGESIGNAGAIRPSAAIALAARIELGQPVNAARYLQRMEEGMASAGILPMYVRMVVEALLAVGEVKQAERSLEQAMRHSGGRLRELLNASARGDLLVQLGARHWREAERSLERAIALGREIGAWPPLAIAQIVAGELALLRGDVDEATGLLLPALDVCRRGRLGRYARRAERLLAETGRRPAASA